jgi:hypothetical protein
MAKKGGSGLGDDTAFARDQRRFNPALPGMSRSFEVTFRGRADVFLPEWAYGGDTQGANYE